MGYLLHRFGVTLDFALVTPAALDLAVPQFPQTVSEVMRRYPNAWVRASNSAYLDAAAGRGLGAIWAWGRQASAEPAIWPVLVREGKTMRIDAGSRGDYSGASWACAGGPLLLSGGQFVDVEEQVAEQGFAAAGPGERLPRVAVGLRPDGLVIHAAAASMTLPELAWCLAELGCQDALLYHSGAAATLYHRGTDGQAERRLGEDTAVVPCALAVLSEAELPLDLVPVLAGRGLALLGQSQATVSQMEAFCHHTNPWAPYLAQHYLETGARYGVRGDLAFAQSLFETGFFRFGGQVQAWQNNFAGLGATDGGPRGEVFATSEDGILGQVQHLYAYAAAGPLPTGEPLVDRRLHLVARGSAPYVNDLSGRWATTQGYGERIETLLHGILALPRCGVIEVHGAAAQNQLLANRHAIERLQLGVVVPRAPVATTWRGIVVPNETVAALQRPGGDAVATLAAGTPLPCFEVHPDLKWYRVTLPVGGSGWVPAPACTAQAAPETPPAGAQAAVVVLDAGHGGSDSGARGPGGLLEKEVNLDITLRLAGRLRGQVGRVWLTRVEDRDVSLDYRADLATASGGNLLLSIHNNAGPTGARGTETYSTGGIQAPAAVRVSSDRLGCLVQAHLLAAIDSRHSSGSPCAPNDRGVLVRLLEPDDPRDYYRVLRRCFVPAALAEVLFVSHPDDAACLNNPAFRDAMASALSEAVLATLTGASGTCTRRGPVYGL